MGLFHNDEPAAGSCYIPQLVKMNKGGKKIGVKENGCAVAAPNCLGSSALDNNRNDICLDSFRAIIGLSDVLTLA